MIGIFRKSLCFHMKSVLFALAYLTVSVLVSLILLTHCQTFFSPQMSKQKNAARKHCSPLMWNITADLLGGRNKELHLKLWCSGSGQDPSFLTVLWLQISLFLLSLWPHCVWGPADKRIRRSGTHTALSEPDFFFFCGHLFNLVLIDLP